MRQHANLTPGVFQVSLRLTPLPATTTGLEPATSSVTSWCSNQLNYAAKVDGATYNVIRSRGIKHRPEPPRGFEPRSTHYKCAALPIELWRQVGTYTPVTFLVLILTARQPWVSILVSVRDQVGEEGIEPPSPRELGYSQPQPTNSCLSPW